MTPSMVTFSNYYFDIWRKRTLQRTTYNLTLVYSMAEKYAGKLHLLKEDIKERWGEVKENGIKSTVSTNVNVSIDNDSRHCAMRIYTVSVKEEGGGIFLKIWLY